MNVSVYYILIQLSLSEMNMQSSRGGSRGGPRGAPRYPGVRGYRERDERSQPHRFNDQESEGDNFRGGPQGYYNGYVRLVPFQKPGIG